MLSKLYHKIDDLIEAVKLHTKELRHMSTATDNLASAVSNLSDAANALNATVQDAIPKIGSGGTNDAAVQAAADAINQVTSSLKASHDSLDAAVNPPAPSA